MQLTPQQRAYVRKRTTVRDPDPSEEMGELNIVPFLDIVVNLIIFLLATTEAVLAVAQLDAQLPSLGGRRAGGPDAGSTLNLSVTLTRAGVIVSGSGGKLAPGCQQMQSGRVITVPAQGNRLVWSVQRQVMRDGDRVTEHEVGPTARALTECVERIKQEYPDETKVILSADPEIEFENIVGAMDALRGPGPDPLFPDIMLSAGVR